MKVSNFSIERLAVESSRWSGVALVLAVVLGVEAIVSGMQWLLQRQITSDFLLTGLVASGIAAPAMLITLHRVQTEMARIRADHSAQELHLANDRLRLAQQGGRMVFWELDVAANRLIFDSAVLPLLGLPAGQANPTLSDWVAQIHPDDAPAYARQAQDVLSGLKAKFDQEYRLKGLATDWIWVQSRSEITRRDSQGQVLWVAGGTINIDARKRAEQALKDQRRLLDTMLDALPVPVFYKDAQGRYLGFNTMFEHFFHKTRAELIGKSVFELNQPEQAKAYHAKDQALFDQPGTQIYEAQVRDVAGTLRDVVFHKATFNDSEGKVAGLVGAVLDVTELKERETRLRQAQQAAAQMSALLRRIADTSPQMIWAKDTQRRFIFANKAICDGLLHATSTNEPIGLDDMVFAERERNSHPQRPDWHTFGELCQDSDAITLQRMQLSRFDEYGNVRGQFLRLDVLKAPLFDDNGHLLGIVGTARDVTREREQTDKLRLAAQVIEHANEAVLVMDAQYRIIEVNPAFTHITGYSAAEVLDQDVSLLRHDDSDLQRYAVMRAQLKEQSRWSGELPLKRKDGKPFIAAVSLSLIYNAEGIADKRMALLSDVTERKQTEELVWQQANFDALTQLPNRHMWRDRLAQGLKQAQRNGNKLALLYLDLDHFKEVNDTLGHDQGDALLCEAASRIASCVREADTVARLGGDEFSIILCAVDNDSTVQRVAEQIIARVAQPFPLGDHQGWVTASIGVAIFPNDAQDADTLCRFADSAMYQAKAGGRNRSSFYTPAIQQVAQQRSVLRADLHGALKRDEFWLAYQPIVDLTNERPVKAEALLRWQHPTRGLVMPDEFIGLAEESGLIHALGDWVLQQAVQQIHNWQGTLGPNFQISVNKSPLQIHARPAGMPWQRHLTALGVNPRQLVVEITESTLLHLTEAVTDELLAFRDAGIQVALDDFGTGYSSLANLNQLDIDFIKIDRHFVAHLETSESSRVLTHAVIAMAHELGLQVVAEGIETSTQLTMLRDMACDFGQGNYWCEPVPAVEFEGWVRDHQAA